MIFSMLMASERVAVRGPGHAVRRNTSVCAIATRVASMVVFLLAVVMGTSACSKDDYALEITDELTTLADELVEVGEQSGVPAAQAQFEQKAPQMEMEMKRLAELLVSPRLEPETLDTIEEQRMAAITKVSQIQAKDPANKKALAALVADFTAVADKELVKAPWETVSPWATLPQASTFADSTDSLYLFIVALSGFFFVVIIGVQGYFMWKYRRRSEDQKTSSISHNGKIEFLWSAIPTILLVVIFVWGELDFLKQTVAPTDAIQVRVTGRQWFWTVDYPDYPGVQLTSSVEDNEVTLVVPKGRPVQLTMTSEDVLHDFYIPAFRLKRDVVPGRYTTLWFEATQIGDFNLYCAEYCGQQHSAMIGRVKVLSPDRFEDYLAEAGKLELEEGESMAAFGQRIYSKRGCNACHSVDGSPKVGPSWKGIWGRNEATDKGSVTVDDNYITESIYEPNAKIVSGYEGVKMPSYKGQLDQKQITAVIEYMKTLK